MSLISNSYLLFLQVYSCLFSAALQKVYNLTHLVINSKNEKDKKNKEFEIRFNNYILKITDLIDNFQLNVVIANIYTIYNLFNSALNEEVDNECLKKNLTVLMKVLIPFAPHLAYECLEKLEAKDINIWPKLNLKYIEDEKIKIAIQINGKTKEVIEVVKDLDEKNAINESKKNKKISEQLMRGEIKKIIFVKNKIINYLIK